MNVIRWICGRGDTVDEGDRIHLYRTDKTYWSCDVDAFDSCIQLAMKCGWQPEGYRPDAWRWHQDTWTEADDAAECGAALVLGLSAIETAGPWSAAVVTLPARDWNPARRSLLRDLIEYCREGAFGYVDDDFPALSMADEMLRRAREVATKVDDLGFSMAVTGCSSSKDILLQAQRYRVLNALDRYLGGDEVQQVVKETQELHAATTFRPSQWRAYVEGDLERVCQLREQGNTEAGTRLYQEVMRYIRSEEPPIEFSTSFAQGAEKAKRLIADSPELGLPGSETRLLEKCGFHWVV